MTPRRTRLVRVPDLRAFRRAILRLATVDGLCSKTLPPEPSLAGSRERTGSGSRLVLVPTDGAARQLRRTSGREDLGPDIVTREELYDRLRVRLSQPPRLLMRDEREVIMRAAAREASTKLSPAPDGSESGSSGDAPSNGPGPQAGHASSSRPGSPFSRLRPGLIAAIVDFYDELRRHRRTVSRFEEQLEESLSNDAGYDRGAARTLAQTRLLAETFRGYQRRLASAGATDEHALRDRLMAEAARDPIRGLVVTVGDWIADPNGLFVADFDLLTRLPGLETIDIVATDLLLSSGFHERLHEWLPGLEEVEDGDPEVADEPPPSLVVPGGEADRLVFVERDRQEELIAIVRRLEVLQDGTSGGRTAVVFKRPLPYLYLAGLVFGRARIPYHASDRLPLAAEPFAAALDVVFEFVESGFTRRSAVALLRSPHFRFEHETRTIELAAVSALDRALSDKRYLGGLEPLVRMCEQWNAADDRKYPAARPALGAVRSAAETLAPLLVVGAASAQLRRVIEFLDRHARPTSDGAIGAALGRRLSRARTAIVDAIDSLARAHAAHDDRLVAMADIAAAVRHVIGGLAFLPEAGEAGVELLDAEAARYGRFAAMAIVGLVEGEWPDPPKRNIFYSTSLLVSLGWPMEKDRRSAMETRFVELLGSASGRVTVSTFRLEDETLVEPSVFVDEIPRARLLTVPVGAASFEERGTLFADQTLALEPVPLHALDAEAREWAEMRLARPSGEAPAFHGQTGSLPGQPWSVSALETYLGCPFKFFAQHVLRLQEEPEDEEVMDPRSQGEFMHGVFEAFFARWQHDGHGAITPANFDVARAVFTGVVDERLGGLSGSEAALERARLLGSPASAGLGEAVFRMEAERPVAVVARQLEQEFGGDFVFATPAGPRVMALRGKADRVDLLADGTFRVIDYKLGWPPDKARALQLPIYGLCAEQRLDGHLGRHWTLGEAAYIAFRGPKPVVPLFTSAEERGDALAGAQARLTAAVDGIAAGTFPPRPDEVFRCEQCSFAAVCRKDYVGDR